MDRSSNLWIDAAAGEARKGQSSTSTRDRLGLYKAPASQLTTARLLACALGRRLRLGQTNSKKRAGTAAAAHKERSGREGSWGRHEARGADRGARIMARRCDAGRGATRPSQGRRVQVVW